MKYMIVEKFKAGQKPLVYERLQEKGRMLPDGLTSIDSWIDGDGDRCFQLMETDDEELFKVWIANWDDLVEFEAFPVTSSPAAGSLHREAERTASFTIDRVSKRRADTEKPWLEFLDLPTLSMGIYYVAAGTTDRDSHSPHDRDEVYAGISGKGRLTADDEEFEVEAGAIIYVKAGVEHHFHDVTHDLTLLVLFAGGQATMNDVRS